VASAAGQLQHVPSDRQLLDAPVPVLAEIGVIVVRGVGSVVGNLLGHKRLHLVHAESLPPTGSRQHYRVDQRTRARHPRSLPASRSVTAGLSSWSHNFLSTLMTALRAAALPTLAARRRLLTVSGLVCVVLFGRRRALREGVGQRLAPRAALRECRGPVDLAGLVVVHQLLVRS
jgi:hypothetical protein